MQAIPRSVSSRKYSIVSGFFAQDHPDADPSKIGALPPRFGLLDDSPDYWAKFKAQISQLQSDAPEGTHYKLFFLGRHGQGFHNVAEEKYGTEAWDEYWSKKYGDSEITWGPDPLLTPLGIKQAEYARLTWLKEITCGVPVPETCYASPLHRALSTWEATFNDEKALPQKSTVLILETLREECGVHTCDMRNPRSVIQRNFPPAIYQFEPGFTEEDLIWQSDERETKAHVMERAHAVLNKIFEEDQSKYISITAHGGIINGFLGAMGRAPYALPTGGILPLVVKGNLNHVPLLN
ncbi:phosphoglycerate mutase-like protein [Laetiporus sulphureus 93-53]|uniref:Phosphoglycerate mutase-like protein n=1 Tax=Laetiporus sulphureus 93-53 TaxID=1314785 RepID=A0A165FTB1_9APHY|nr:phosphoglycerate mutase-like protein [Laetiporus sulphureus 93-53]KZT09381.1 phosphoglycerate mutase-like protein [Laetiporus sulphureus 93-53]